MQNRIFLYCVIALISVFAAVAPAMAQEADEPYVILVEYTFDEKDIDTAIELLTEMQSKTLENEEGCLVYDLLLSEEDGVTIFIYESYQNEAAFKVHTNSAYFKALVTKKIAPLIKKERVTKVFPLNQEEFLEGEV